MPRPLKERPMLDSRQQYVFKVFNILDDRRQIGMNGPQPFTLESFQSCCDMLGIQGADRRVELLARVNCLDEERLAAAYADKAEPDKQDTEHVRSSP
jgi:hypothetical protein